MDFYCKYQLKPYTILTVFQTLFEKKKNYLSSNKYY